MNTPKKTLEIQDQVARNYDNLRRAISRVCNTNNLTKAQNYVQDIYIEAEMYNLNPNDYNNLDELEQDLEFEKEESMRTNRERYSDYLQTRGV